MGPPKQNMFAIISLWVTEESIYDFRGWVAKPEFVSLYDVFVYKCVYVSGDGASAAGASWFCPALPWTLWGSVLDQGPGPSLRRAAPLQPLQSADSHWHYISWGDTVDYVCVLEV